MKTLANAPVLLPQARWLWRGWETLSAARHYNEAGPQPIQFSEMIAYCAHQRASIWETDVLIRALGRMDQVFLDYHQKKREKAKREQQRKNDKRHGRRRR